MVKEEGSCRVYTDEAGYRWLEDRALQHDQGGSQVDVQMGEKPITVRRDEWPGGRMGGSVFNLQGDLATMESKYAREARKRGGWGRAYWRNVR